MTFDQWWERRDKFDADTIAKHGIHGCCKKAWDAALEAAAMQTDARHQGGQIAERIRALKTTFPD